MHIEQYVDLAIELIREKNLLGVRLVKLGLLLTLLKICGELPKVEFLEDQKREFNNIITFALSRGFVSEKNGKLRLTHVGDRFLNCLLNLVKCLNKLEAYLS